MTTHHAHLTVIYDDMQPVIQATETARLLGLAWVIGPQDRGKMIETRWDNGKVTMTFRQSEN